MAYDNTNSGILARNERRQSDKHPEYTGSINVEGTDYWISAWVNEGRPGSKMEGKKYFSLKLNPKEQRGSASGGGGYQSRGGSGSYSSDGFEDDIPF